MLTGRQREEEAGQLRSESPRHRALQLLSTALVLVVAAAGIAGWLMWQELDSVQRDLERTQEDLIASEAQISGVSRKATEALSSVQGIESTYGSISTELEQRLESATTSVSELSTELQFLSARLSFFEEETKESLTGLGRCLYHEAELHRYNYWYLDHASKGRYITGCE